MKIPKKLRLGMEEYVRNQLLPICYEKAVVLGYQGIYDQYLQEILSALKGEEKE